MRPHALALHLVVGFDEIGGNKDGVKVALPYPAPATAHRRLCGTDLVFCIRVLGQLAGVAERIKFSVCLTAIATIPPEVTNKIFSPKSLISFKPS